MGWSLALFTSLFLVWSMTPILVDMVRDIFTKVKGCCSKEKSKKATKIEILVKPRKQKKKANQKVKKTFLATIIEENEPEETL